MPQVWGLLINQINKLIHHWDCKTKVVCCYLLTRKSQIILRRKTKIKRQGWGGELSWQAERMRGLLLICRTWEQVGLHMVVGFGDGGGGSNEEWGEGGVIIGSRAGNVSQREFCMCCGVSMTGLFVCFPWFEQPRRFELWLNTNHNPDYRVGPTSLSRFNGSDFYRDIKYIILIYVYVHACVRAQAK